MRHSLLRAIPLLGVILSVWIPLSLATPTLHSRIEPVALIVFQQQQREPGEPSLSAAYGGLSPQANPNAVGKRSGIYIQELGADFLVYYHVFTPFAPSRRTAAWLAQFWFQLASAVLDMPDQLFPETVVAFNLGPLRLEFHNVGSATSAAGGVPKGLVFAVACAMLEYSNRGFCGTFNARLSSISAGVKVWISLRIVLEGE